MRQMMKRVLVPLLIILNSAELAPLLQIPNCHPRYLLVTSMNQDMFLQISRYIITDIWRKVREKKEIRVLPRCLKLYNAESFVR